MIPASVRAHIFRRPCWFILLAALGAPVVNGSTPEQVIRRAEVIRLPIVDGTDIRFSRFYTVEGPSKSNAGPFVQDDQGFIWFGTPYGLNRFDGYTFKVFVHDPANPKSISSSYVNSLFKDRDGILWAGCDQYLNRFDSENEAFTRYPIPFVDQISQDAHGTLWLSASTGLYSLNPANGKIKRYSNDPGDPASLESNEIKSSGEDREGRFWVGTTEGLDLFDRSSGKVTLHIPVYEASHPLSFYEDRFGVFWVYHVSGNPLAVFDWKTKTLTQFSFEQKSSRSPKLTGITGMLEDHNGDLWLATNGAGLLKFDREHRRFISYRHSLGDPESLAQDSVHSIFQDREGVIWTSLGGFGLTRFTTKSLPLKRYRHEFGNPADRDEPFVGAILEDSRGILWIGTHNALHRIDRTTGQYKDFYFTGPGTGTDAITICQDRSGDLWVGTYGHGIFHFDPRTNLYKNFKHDPANPQSLSNDIVPRVFVDHAGTLWAATHDGLDRFNPATSSFTTFRVKVQAVHPNYLDIAEDREGRLWLGTESSGLLRFDPATGQFTIFQRDIDQSGTLSDNRVNSVHFDHAGTMWVGTQQGLNRFDADSGRFSTISEKNGLPGNDVACILEDDKGKLWMSTDNGLAQFDPQNASLQSYTSADGLPGPDLTGWGTCFQSRTGEMFFGGFSGATAFFPNDVGTSQYIPPISLTDLRLFGAEVDPGPKSTLHKAINYTDAITLSHEQNIFSIGFSALSYLNPTTNRYRYMLEGLDRTWNEVGSDRRFATYTTLPAGDYTFRVEGATNRGRWDEPGAILHIKILPAWWNTSWFRIVCFAALLLLVTAIYLHRKRLRKKESERIERLHQAQTDLDRTSKVIIMGELAASIAHEIKQPIGAAVTNAEVCVRLLDRDEPDLPEARDAAVEMIRDARRAADIIEHVRSLYRKGSSPQEIVDVNEVIREMILMLQKEANRHSITMSADLTDAPVKVIADRVQLQQVLMNLMLNGIEAMRDTTGDLGIKSQLDEGGQILISVSDTGEGLPDGNADHVFNAFFTTKPQGTGLGLAITRSIVEAHGGRIWANANSGQGATFQFTLPITEGGGK